MVRAATASAGGDMSLYLHGLGRTQAGASPLIPGLRQGL